MVQEYLLLFLAAFGHGCLWTVALNVVYGFPLHRMFLRAFRLLVGLVVFGGPIVYWFAHGPTVSAAFQSGACWALTAYIGLTLVIACLVCPVVTISRLCRRDPPFVRSQTVTVDIAKELGSPPIGDGEAAATARLPFNDIFRVEFTALTVALPNLPAAWDGLNLLQLSDLHFYGTPAQEYYAAIVDRCLQDGIPDLLLITGDIIDGNQYIAWLQPVLGRLRWNIAACAILGNHDWWHDFEGVREGLRRLQIHVVSDSWKQLDVRGEKLTIIGHEGPWFRPPPDMSRCPVEGFRLLLSHSPDNIAWARRHQVRLMLSGHNHGGQVRVPVFGSIFVPSKYSRRYDMGTFFEPPTLLHVNRGLSGKDPLRFMCRPQVTRIILKAADGA